MIRYVRVDLSIAIIFTISHSINLPTALRYKQYKKPPRSIEI